MLISEWTLKEAGDFINQVGFPISLFVFAAICIIWYARTFGPGHKAKIDADRKLSETLTEHIPKQTETLRVLHEGITESRNIGSDVIKEIHNTKQAAGELSYGIEAMSIGKPEDVSRYMARARQRLGIDGKKKADSDG